jgi:nucleoside 2-deoxyribosyltransferase
MMRVYLAAHYSRKDEIKAAAKELQEIGIKVMSTWFNERKTPNTSLTTVSDTFRRTTAKRDVGEIRCSDYFVLFSLHPDTPFTRGGHVFENGYAVACGLRTLVVGPKQHIFHYLRGVKRVDTWKQGKRWLLRELAERAL